MSLTTGQILQGRYHIISHLGKGGMGTVYQAQDMRLNRRLVAVKEFDPAQLPPNDRQIALQAFQQEAEILAGLNHPGLTAVYDYFLENNRSYLVMEFVNGETLQQAWERLGRRFAEAQVVTWTRELCDVLSYLHSQQPPVIFRDLKPGNIMVQPNGHLKLIDFGIARHFTPGKTSDTTKFGTPGYAAPEQYGHGQTDARSDIYALGVVTYQLLTGHDPTQTPFHLPPISQLAPQVSPPISQAVMQAVEIDPAKRPSTAPLFCQMLSVAGPGSAVKRTMGRWMGAAVLLVLGTSVLLRLFIVNLANGATTSAQANYDSTTSSFAGVVTETTTAAATIIATTTATETAVPPTITPESTVTLDAGTRRVINDDELRQVFVPAGEFFMGSDAGNTDEGPVHAVYLDTYWIDQMEVTNTQFAGFVAAAGYETTAESTGRGWIYDGGWRVVNGANWHHPQGPGSSIDNLANHPVVQVSWYDAQAYCVWYGRRLPTEAEWEKAARGADQRLYPWGNTFDGARLNFCDVNCSESWADIGVNDGYAITAPVGSYPAGASIYGALDMVGNAWEWVADWYGGDYYTSAPYENPIGPVNGQRKVLRGGSWQFSNMFTRTIDREVSIPGDYNDSIGFRCAQDGP